jgi:DNA-binding NtrC family response regulator
MGKLREMPVRVLCVDDEPPILMALKYLLEGEDFELLTATSAECGLEIVKEHDDIGVVIADQQMPTMSGVEFLEKVWEVAPDTVRIMLTGHGDMAVASDAINKGGAFRYITKPWRNSELLQSLRDAVQIYRLLRENRRLTSIIGTLGGKA